MMNDSIEYEIVNWSPREVWKCQTCKRYRHRDSVKGLLPAICCGEPAKLVMHYEQPKPFMVSEPIPAEFGKPRDERLELLMAEMQAASLLFPQPTPEPTQDFEQGA